MNTTFSTNQTTHHKFKKKCLDQDKSMSEVLTALMDAYVRNPEILKEVKK